MIHREEYLGTDGLQESIEDILKSYSASVIDFSIHEFSVFWLKHSDADVGEPYNSFEAKFLVTTKDLFTKIDPKRWGKSFMETFISLDLQLVSAVFLNRTVKTYIKRVCDTQVGLIEGSMSNTSKKINESLTDSGLQHHSSYTNAPQNANLNLILQHSTEPIRRQTNNTHVSLLREALLEEYVDRIVYTDSEDEENTPKSAIGLKKTTSCAREMKKISASSTHTDLYRSLSQCTDLSSISPVSEQKELIASLV